MDYKEIAQTLKRLKIPRSTLADRLGVSSGTVDHWLCGHFPIPARKRVLIEELLRDERHPSYSSVAAYAVRFSTREIRRITERWGVVPTPVAMEKLVRSVMLDDKRGPNSPA